MDDSASPKRRLWPAIVAIYQGAAWGGFCGFLLWYVPPYEKIYRDFRMEIPATAKLFINLTHFLHDHWIVVVTLIAVWMATTFVAASMLNRVRSDILKYGWYLLTSLAPFVLLVLANLAVALPMFGLIKDLSQ